MISPVNFSERPPVAFSGSTRVSVERMVNSLFHAEDTFNRIDRLEGEKLRPWYEKIAGDFLRIGRVRAEREIRESAARMDKALIAALDEADYSKTGGLESAYWRAYHIPGQLAGKKSADTVRRIEQFVEIDYAPLLKSCRSEEERWTVISMAEGLLQTASPEEVLVSLEKMAAVAKNQPQWWCATLDVFEAHKNLLTDVFYDTRSPMLKTDRESQYRHCRNLFVRDVMVPLFDAIGDRRPSETTQRFLENVLPEVLGGLGKHQPMETPGRYLAGVRAEALTLLWRTLVLDGDLQGAAMDAAVSRQFGNTIARLKAEAEGDAPRYNGPDMPVTHCNLPATIPEHY